MTVELDAVLDLCVELTEEAVWRCLGAASHRNPALVDEVALAVREAPRLGRPAAVMRSLAVLESGRGRVSLEHGIDLEGRILPHLFEGATGAVFLVATAGPGVERRTSELFERDETVEAFVMDAAGTGLAMEAMAQAVGAASKDLGSAGMKTGPCLVPGNDYWLLEGQRALFRAVPAERIGVQLLDSMVMVPQKSQSAVIPFGEELSVQGDPTASRCRTCKAVRCPIRTEEYAGDPGSLPA